MATGVAWGLGWGMEPAEGTFFHWGNNGAYKAFAIGSVESRDAVVFFMNGASGLCLMPGLLEHLMPGDRPSLAWLDYGRHDAPLRRILRTVRSQGVAATWREMDDAGLGADELLWIARGLSAAGLDDDSQSLRERIKQQQVANSSSAA